MARERRYPRYVVSDEELKTGYLMIDFLFTRRAWTPIGSSMLSFSSIRTLRWFVRDTSRKCACQLKYRPLQLMTQQGLQTIDMRHTLPNVKNLLLTLTSTLEDDEVQRYVATQQFQAKNIVLRKWLHSERNDRAGSPLTPVNDDTVLQRDTASTTPINGNTLRRPFFTPISGFWLSKRDMNGPFAAPSLPSTPELSASEAVESIAPPPTQEETSVNGGPTFHHVSGISTEPRNVSKVDDEDTETIKDGVTGTGSSIGVGAGSGRAAQGGWLTKAFFGQIEREKSHSHNRKRSGLGPGLDVAHEATNI